MGLQGASSPRRSPPYSSPRRSPPPPPSSCGFRTSARRTAVGDTGSRVTLYTDTGKRPTGLTPAWTSPRPLLGTPISLVRPRSALADHTSTPAGRTVLQGYQSCDSHRSHRRYRRRTSNRFWRRRTRLLPLPCPLWQAERAQTGRQEGALPPLKTSSCCPKTNSSPFPQGSDHRQR